jgi:hypothetical protein
VLCRIGPFPSHGITIYNIYKLNVLDNISKSHPSAGIMLIGDFNHLNDCLLKQYPLHQVVRDPTRGKAILDKIYTNLQSWYQTPIILPRIGNSDHNVIVFSPKGYSSHPHGKRIRVLTRSNDRNSKVLLEQALKNHNWSVMYRMNTTEAMCDYFYNTVNRLLNEYLPTRYVFRHSGDKPWITDRFRMLIRQRQHAHSTGDMTKYRSLRNQVNRESKRLQKSYSVKMSTKFNGPDNHNWWREINQLSGRNNSSVSVFTTLANSLTGGDMQRLSDLFIESLKHVSSDLQPLNCNFDIVVNSFPDEFTIYPEEVFRKLSNINIHKSPGPDGIPNWVLRDFAYILSEPVCSIFNSSLRQCEFPGIWKKANITMIPKVPKPESINDDFRPISLTQSTISKVFESLVGQCLLEQVEPQFDERQFGARKKRSTIHALINFVHLAHSALDSGQLAHAVFIDYSKAFDHVDHSIVIHKLISFGINPWIVKLSNCQIVKCLFYYTVVNE